MNLEVLTLVPVAGSSSDDWSVRLADRASALEQGRLERGRIPTRIGIACATSIFLFRFSTPLTGATWLCLILLAETVELAACFKFADRPTPLRVALLANAFFCGLLWTSYAVILWFSQADVAYIAAVISLLSVALYGALGSYHSRSTFLLLAGPPLVTLVGLTGFYGWTHYGAFLGIVCGLATLGACSTVVENFFNLYHTHRALNRSHLALQEANQNLEELAAQAEAANTAKSHFLATFSHEIRTPLNGVLGMAQAMRLDELSPAQRERLQMIFSSGSSLRSVLNDLLDITKIEAGKLELEETAFDLGQFFELTAGVYSALATEKGLKFTLDLAPEARTSVIGDPARLRQVVDNLLNNALKFTSAGEIEVKVSRSPDHTIIVVRDTGAGIPAERLEGIFDPYVQGESSTSRRFGGTGLGLAICSQLARLMRGRITVESALGHGSTFTLTISLPPSSVPAESRAADEDLHELGDLSTLRVLVAEDHKNNQIVMDALLQPFGVAPVFVNDGEAALRNWEEHDFDLVFMDVNMPVLDGLTAASRIREREALSGRPRTRIYALTADALAHQVEEYLSRGLDGHLAKPIELQSLLTILHEAAQR